MSCSECCAAPPNPLSEPRHLFPQLPGMFVEDGSPDISTPDSHLPTTTVNSGSPSSLSTSTRNCPQLKATPLLKGDPMSKSHAMTGYVKA